MTTNRPFEAEPAAIKGAFAKYLPVPSRNVLQLIVEVPLEQQKQVFDALGYPLPKESLWVAVARLNASMVAEKPAETKGSDSTSTAKRPFHELPRSQQAGILCNDERFAEWLKTTDPAREVRRRCRVQSRADLNEGHPYFDPASAAIFDNLVSDYRHATGQEARRD